MLSISAPIGIRLRIMRFEIFFPIFLDMLRILVNKNQFLYKKNCIMN